MLTCYNHSKVYYFVLDICCSTIVILNITPALLHIIIKSHLTTIIGFTSMFYTIGKSSDQSPTVMEYIAGNFLAVMSSLI